MVNAQRLLSILPANVGLHCFLVQQAATTLSARPPQLLFRPIIFFPFSSSYSPCKLRLCVFEKRSPIPFTTPQNLHFHSVLQLLPSQIQARCLDFVVSYFPPSEEPLLSTRRSTSVPQRVWRGATRPKTYLPFVRQLFSTVSASWSFSSINRSPFSDTRFGFP